MTSFSDAKKAFCTAIQSDQHVFADTLAFVARWFEFEPSGFSIGSVRNEADSNQGSCQVLALAQQLALSHEEALLCFGEHYREVLATPDVDNHHNLRRLLSHGFADAKFDTFPLTPKQ